MRVEFEADATDLTGEIEVAQAAADQIEHDRLSMAERRGSRP